MPETSVGMIGLIKVRIEMREKNMARGRLDFNGKRGCFGEFTI